ncbi:MAG: hypothetical protein QF535_12590, partial [Anaerolineales bacterium]|nr:hypothetical protein [Anaerolineales bacterium]
DAADRIAVSQFTITMATTGAYVSGVNVYGFTDSGYTSPVSGLSADGGFLVTDKIGSAGDGPWATSATQLEFAAEDTSSASTTIEIPAGQTRYFEVRGTVSSASTGDSVSTQLEGDADYLKVANQMIGLGSTTDETHNDFFWSPISTTTGSSAYGDLDWTNGFNVGGLPSSNMGAEVLSL